MNQKLEPGHYDQCHACRRPITEEDKQSAQYQAGVSCPYCHDEHDEEQKQRYAERERQMRLARERGETHIGEPMSEVIRRRREEKLARKEKQRRRGG